MAKDLKASSRKGLVIAGRRQPYQVHALVLAINSALGNIGKTIKFVETKDVQLPSQEEFTTLLKEIHRGTIKQLIILGGNPAYNAPADLTFPEILKKVPLIRLYFVPKKEIS